MSSQNYHFSHKLGQLTSHAGMKYLDRFNIMERPRRNAIVVKALKDAKDAAKEIFTKQYVDEGLAAIMQACREELDLYVRFALAPKHLSDFLDAVQKKNTDKLPDWAAGLSGSTFLELFWRLVEARHKYTENRVPPWNEWEHAPVAAEVDAFMESLSLLRDDGYGWVENEASWYQAVDGFGADEDEDKEKKKEKETSGRNMEMGGLGDALTGIQKNYEANDAMQEDIPEAVEKMDLD